MDHGTNPYRARSRRPGEVIAGLAAVALLATACTGGAKSPGVASVGATSPTTLLSGASRSSASTTAVHPAPSPGPSRSSGSTTTTVTPPGPSGRSGRSGPGSSEETSQSQQLLLARCMRSNGVPNFPDPSPNRGFLNTISASGIKTHSPAFQAAVQACSKYNPSANVSPAQSAADNAKALEFSECMRTHGVPNYPDPSTGPVGEQVIDLRGKGIDLSSPTFQTANNICQKIVPGGK